MNIEKLNKMDTCRHLLPEPGPEVVGELIAELRKYREVLGECKDYLKARNLGKAADGLLVKCCGVLADSANTSVSGPHPLTDSANKESANG